MAEKRGLPKPLERLQTILKKGLQATETDWETLEQMYGWVHQIAEVFDETQPLRCEERQGRFHERRATGRRAALPGLVVHGAVRVQATLATRLRRFTAHELAPYDIQAWRTLRAEVFTRQEGRRKQWRFRKDPPAYLAALEAQLLKDSLRS